MQYHPASETQDSFSQNCSWVCETHENRITNNIKRAQHTDTVIENKFNDLIFLAI